MTVNHQIRPYKILISTSTSYFPSFLNWLIYYYHVCGDDRTVLHIICLDKEIESNLKYYGLTCSFVHYLPEIYTFNRLWLVRAKVTKELLASGYDVLMSDSDALWLRNPFLDIEYYAATSDIIGTRATFPNAVLSKIGATLCMGFIYIKSSSKVVTLWDTLINQMIRLRNPDDQKLLNEVMMKFKLRFPYKLSYKRSYEVDHGYLMLEKEKIRVSMLPQNSYRRICSIKNRKQILANTTILHCLVRVKDQEKKRLTGEKYGMWLLNESAISIEYQRKNYGSSFDSFISSIALESPERIIPNKYALS